MSKIQSVDYRPKREKFNEFDLGKQKKIQKQFKIPVGKKKE
jgi:hypothetical protein